MIGSSTLSRDCAAATAMPRVRCARKGDDIDQVAQLAALIQRGCDSSRTGALTRRARGSSWLLEHGVPANFFALRRFNPGAIFLR